MDVYSRAMIILAACVLVGIGGVFFSQRWIKGGLWLLSVPPFCLGVLALIKGRIPEEIQILSGFQWTWSPILFWPAIGCLIGDFIRDWHANISARAVIFLSRDIEAAKYDHAPRRFRDKAECRGITTLELTKLWTVIQKVEESATRLDEFPCLLQKDYGRQFIHRFPADLVADLSRLTPEMVAVTAKRTANEVWGWSEKDTRRLVEEMVRLSRLALETKRNVYLWNYTG